MEFDKSKVYTALNADESLIGAKGYFGTYLNELKRYVTTEDDTNCNSIVNITDFIQCDTGGWNFFYLVESAPEKWYVF